MRVFFGVGIPIFLAFQDVLIFDKSSRKILSSFSRPKIGYWFNSSVVPCDLVMKNTFNAYRKISFKVVANISIFYYSKSFFLILYALGLLEEFVNWPNVGYALEVFGLLENKVS